MLYAPYNRRSVVLDEAAETRFNIENYIETAPSIFSSFQSNMLHHALSPGERFIQN